MKSIFDGIKDTKGLTYNYEGHIAWQKPLKELTQALLMTGSFGNTFYVDQTANLKLAIEVFNKAAQQHPKWFKDTIVYARNEGFMKSMPILALAILRQYNTETFHEIFDKVILTGKDLDTFMSMNRALGLGFGRSTKRAIEKWISTHTTEYYAIKYRRQIADAIRLTHYKSDDPIYHYVVAYRKKVDTNKLVQAYTYKQIAATEAVRRLIDSKMWDAAAKLIEGYRLDPATVIGMGTPKKDENGIQYWISVMRQMGTGMLIGYLSKLIRTGAINEETLPWLQERLSAQAILRAKIHPHRLLTTYLALEDIDYPYIVWNRPPQYNEENAPMRKHVMNILKDRFIEMANNIKSEGKWRGKYVIAPDISPSMTSPIGTTIPSFVAGAFAGMLSAIADKSIILPWHTEVELDLLKDTSDPFQVALDIATAPGYGTFMETPVKYMIKKHIQADYAIFITDSMEWGEGWLKYWRQYKRKISPKTKAVLIRVDPYPTNPYPETVKEELDIYTIHGWSPAVLQWIEEYVLAA